MQPILIKVYGSLYPAAMDVYKSMDNICRNAIPSTQDSDSPAIVELSEDLLRISFEGIYFPKEEVLNYLKNTLTFCQQGKLDFLDLESWRLERYLFKDGKINYHSAPLNNVLDYSGH